MPEIIETQNKLEQRNTKADDEDDLNYEKILKNLDVSQFEIINNQDEIPINHNNLVNNGNVDKNENGRMETKHTQLPLFLQTKTPIVWGNAVFFLFLYVWFFYSFITIHIRASYLVLFYSYLYVIFIGRIAGFGVMGGVHRYWTHRSFKATLPLQIILAFAYLMAGQNKIYDWVRDHRVHHKYSETDADPHNAKRGFFFAHIGWLMLRKHPDVIQKGKQIDMSDIVEDKVVQFVDKHFMPLKVLICFVIPVFGPVYLWNETWWNSFVLANGIRYMLVLNFQFLINSAAHMYGMKPYDKNIGPTDNQLISSLTMGGAWHNYHHTFPWDYKESELGKYNKTTEFLQLFSKIGWAYDFKEASENLVRHVVRNRGDGSHLLYGDKEVPESENDKFKQK